MRLLQQSLVALMLVAILLGVVLQTRRERDTDRASASTRESLSVLQRQILVQAALQPVGDTRSYPETVDPAWFEATLPVNHLFADDPRPWVEVAPASQRHLEHPPGLAAVSEHDGTFWYNPYRGIVRARVPAQVSDRETLALYNKVNATALASVFPGDE